MSWPAGGRAPGCVVCVCLSVALTHVSALMASDLRRTSRRPSFHCRNAPHTLQAHPSSLVTPKPCSPAVFCRRHEYTDTHCVHGDTCANAQCTVGGRHQSLHILSGAVLPLMPVRGAVHVWLSGMHFAPCPAEPLWAAVHPSSCSTASCAISPSSFCSAWSSCALAACGASEFERGCTCHNLLVTQAKQQRVLAKQQPPVLALQSMR